MKCPCHSGKIYSRCCEPFHKGAISPETPEKLMRSRYAAYALKLVDYVIETTHPKSPTYETNLEEWKKSIEQFCQSTTFTGLTIDSTTSSGHTGTVLFHAHLKQGDQDVSFREHSLFTKVGEKWLYRGILQ